MRFALLSSVSFVFLALTPMAFPTIAHAGFEFVPPPAAAAPTAPVAPSPVTAVENAPVTSENLDPAPYVDTKATLPAAPPVQPAASPIADVPVAPLPPVPADEPMVLGRKAIPLTPVVKESDALIFDEAPLTSSLPVPTIDAAPALKKTIVETTQAPANVANTHDVLWDSKPTMMGEAMISDDLPPAMPPVGAPELVAPKIAASDIEDGLPVQGFGRQVPLAMALQQIVPSNYRYSFDTGVDPGMRVSWTGGKSWKAIVTDLARDNNLNVDIVTNVVAFHRRTPMDVLSGSTNVDMSADTVQGMPLRPVTEEPIELPLIDSDAMVAPRTVTEKRQALASKSAEVQETRRAQFDSMLDTDNPAEALVRNKRILTADDDAEKAAIVFDKPAKKQKEIIEEKPAATVKKDKTIDVASFETPAAPIVTTDIVTPAEEELDVLPAPMISADAAPMNIVPPASGEPVADTLPVQDEWMKPLPIDEIAAAPSVAAEVSANVPSDLTTSREWEGFKNQTLRETLTTWSQTAGVSVVWSSEYDYPLQTDVRVEANYGDAVRTLLAGFSKAQPRPVGRLFKNDKVGAQPVLVVETQRLTN